MMLMQASMKDKDPESPADNRPPGEPKQSGRVAYDSKGNPVWEWETSTGVYDRDVSTQRLKKLEAKLSLEETRPVPVLKPKNLSLQDAERLPGGGMNPYDTGAPASGRIGPAAHPALVHKQAARDKATSKSLVSKHAAKQKTTETPPQGLWGKLKSRIKGDK
jgi:hypothetical protein